MQRVELEVDTDQMATEGSDFTAAAATLIMERQDGRQLTQTVEHEIGSPRAPPKRPEFESKFRRCTKEVLSSDNILLAMRYLYQLETLPDFDMVPDAMSRVAMPPSPHAYPCDFLK